MRTYAAAGECRKFVFIEAAGGGGVEREMGDGEREEGEQQGNHCDCDHDAKNRVERAGFVWSSFLFKL